MALLNIAGGVALILFGIRFLRKGLERLFGQQLYDWIERAARRPWQAAAAGLAFGTVAPSSTAQTLVALQLLRAGRLSADSVLGFLLGANLGITFTVQLIALRIFDYYAVFLTVGLILFQGAKRETFRGAGQSLLGLGFIFLAMEVTSNAANVLAANPDFNTMLGVLVHYRLLIVLFAAVLTLAMQSSTATLGLALAIGGAGAAQLDLLIPIVLGTNLGIGLTSLVAGLPTWEGRRLAAANLLLKGSVIVVFLALIPLPLTQHWIEVGGGSIAREVANFHTAFNLLVTFAGILLAGPIGRLLQRTMKPAAVAAGAQPPATHLDPDALATPAFALANAARETLREVDAVKAMFEDAWKALATHDAALAAAAQRQDDRIDELNANIKAYLSQIRGEALSPKNQQLQFGLLNFSSQLESIGDVIDKSLCATVRDHARERVQLAPADQSDLEEMHRKVLHRFDTAISVLATRDRDLALQFLQEGDAVKEWSVAVQKRHFASLAAGEGVDLVASTRFLDTFNVLRRISGQLNTIGHTFTLT